MPKKAGKTTAPPRRYRPPAHLQPSSTASSSILNATFDSDDDDDDEPAAQPAKFDVRTIPMHKLSLNPPGGTPSSPAQAQNPARLVPGRVPYRVTTASGTVSYNSMAEAEAAAEAEIEAEERGESVQSAPPPEMELVDGTLVEKGELERRRRQKPFRFLDLPSELRVKVYAYFFEGVDRVADLCPENYRRLRRRLWLLRTCRTVYAEASYFYYSTHPVRLFPTSPGRFFKTRRPLLVRLRPHQRAALTSLELRLGPGFNKPPKGWAVTRRMGLGECVNVRRLYVFVQIDPSMSWLDGFRKQGFYEDFSRALLEDVLRETPNVEVVELDAYESVRKSSPIVAALLAVAQAHGKRIVWGPTNGWTETSDSPANVSAALRPRDPRHPLEAGAGPIVPFDPAILALA